ncbi:WG repeat-containing protein [Achromobacter spanius]|uniref:WG repeat-containing protein n=1 Tax=Achromobacter spanius TaxID=217203 RepID=A0AA42LPJ7_9BURK|nr:WG repeat-containing protein [Achromobacter spanius]MDH0737172.1 hypothetical protein [Achromobacter spanius]
MLKTLLFTLLAALPAAALAANPVDANPVPTNTAPTDAASTRSSSSHDLQCLYAAKQDGGMLEPADQCARVEGDTVVFAADVLGRMDFNEDGLSPVFTHGSWRWVRPDGKSVAVVTFDNFADDFEDGLTRGPWMGGMAYYDKQLNRVLATDYEWVDRYSGGLAVVCEGCRKTHTPDGEHSYMTGGQWGAIDRQGKLALPLRPDAASLMREVEAARAAAASTGR